jgi:hypothetical protein
MLPQYIEYTILEAQSIVLTTILVQLPAGELMDDKQNYLRWLEEMWDVQKFDIHGSAEREEKRTEEVLEMFKGLARLSRHHIESPDFPAWAPPDGRDGSP